MLSVWHTCEPVDFGGYPNAAQSGDVKYFNFMQLRLLPKLNRGNICNFNFIQIGPMLKTIRDAFDAARNLLSPNISFLRQGFSGLDSIDKKLADRIQQFIVDGNDAAVLTDLSSAKQNAGVLIGNPGRLTSSFYSHGSGKEVELAAKESLAARNQFYEKIDPASPPLEVLIRLGKALEAVDQRRSLTRSCVSLPDWLQYLLNDALWASFNNYRPNVDEKNRPAWDVTLIHRILAHEELPPLMAMLAVFERGDVGSYYLSHVYTRLLAAGPLDDYLLKHADNVNTAADALSASGKLVLGHRLAANARLVENFAPLLTRLSVCGAKTVRAEMAKHLDLIEQARRIELLVSLLTNGKPDERAQAAELLARTPVAECAKILEDALAKETSKPVQQAIRNAISRLQAVDDASTLTLPDAPGWEPVEDTPLKEDALQLLYSNRKELLERHRKSAEEEAERNKTAKYKYEWQKKHFERYSLLTDDVLRDAFHALNGQDSGQNLAKLGSDSVNETLAFGGKLEALPEFQLHHIARWLGANTRRHGQFWMDHRFQRWLRRQDPQKIDLRMLAESLKQASVDVDAVATSCLRQWWGGHPRPIDILPADRIWPFFEEHPEWIDEGLGLRGSSQSQYNQPGLGPTLDTLDVFPVIPARWLPRLLEIALGDGKTYRPMAQKVLSKLPDIGKQVTEALGSSKLEIRIEASRWLVTLNHHPAVPALYAALAKESRETVRAAFLTALEALGEDISSRLAPDVLLAEARKGLKAKAPSGLAWFSMEALPSCKWEDGTAVDPDIIRWWVILACKLKEPGGNALLERYMGLLHSASAAAIGSTILRQFIAQDTRHPSNEEGIAHAQAHAQQRYQQYQDWAKRYPAYYESHGKMTPEQVFEQVKREKMAEYAGSAIGEKGVLALIHGAPGHELVSLLQSYTRDHYQRRSQIEAMIEGAALSSDSVVIQMLLGLSRRYRTASVQEKARSLVEQIAMRNGWTREQLADRTIPSAGFDENGYLELQYGERTFSVTLDESMKPVLKNSEDKVIKALPAPRQNDPADSIKEAKQQFAACKKELKQVLDMQTARLYEAMCSGRIWPAAEWREYLHKHPIVGRLVQRLVWAEVTEDGHCSRLWRPTEDGSLIDAQDDEVELSNSARVRLAHASVVSGDDAQGWIGHFKDYKIVPLFPQMSRKLPEIAKGSNGLKVSEETIADRMGWISDAFTLRGTFTKLGYQRAQAEDGGVFYQYTKEFTSIGVRVVIEFSGNALPEENVAAALKTLSFEDMKVKAYGQRGLALKDVPPVLLTEAYADYHAVATACAGFDPEWEKKMPW